MPAVKKDVSKEIERKFFWGVAYTLQPGFVDALIREAQGKRREQPVAKAVPHLDAIISDKFATLLLKDPFISCK